MTRESLRIVLVGDPVETELPRRRLSEDADRAYRFTSVATGSEGVEACSPTEGPRPDCAIVSHRLPDGDGLAVLDRLKETFGEVPVPVVYYIDSGEECRHAAAALRAGAQDYIAKSWLTADGLSCAVAGAMERFELRERLKSKRATIERREREFQALVEHAPEIVARLDGSHRYVYINPAVERATGRPVSAFTGLTPAEAGLPPESAALWEAALGEAGTAGKPVRFEYDLPGPEGTRRHQARVVSLLDGDGAVESTLVVSTDVTRLKRAEDALRAGEEHVRDVIDRIVAFVGVTDPDGILVEANRPALDCGGLAAEDVLGKPFADAYWFSHSSEARSIVRGAVELAAGGRVARTDVEIRVGPRKFASLDLMIAPLVDDEGRITHLIASGVDVTERLRAEKSTREIAAREKRRTAELRAVLRATPAAIWIAKDPDCRVIEGNPASYELLGLPERTNVSATPGPDAGVPRPYREYVDGAPVRPEDLPMQRAAKGVEVRGAELTLRFDDGSERHIYGNAMPLRGPGGAVRGVISAFIDVTKLKRAEREARESDRRKGEFLSMLAHELRNPLAAIRTAVHVLSLKGTDHSRADWAHEVIDRQAKHLTRLIEDLLDLSRISSGEIRLKPEEIDLRDVVSWALDTVWPLTTSKGHTIEVVLPPEPMTVRADPVRVQQVLGNLLTNAAKYTDNGGTIRVTGSTAEGFAELRIEDNGIGIAAELLPKVFSLHAQGEPRSARSLGGLGIGLSLVRMIVEAHCGTVSAESAGLGLGSAFTVLLPVAEAVGRTSDTVAVGLPRPGPWRRRGIVVDGNVGAAEGLANQLEAFGFEVKTAHDRASARDLAREFRPGFAIMDLDSEAVDGRGLARDLLDDPFVDEIRLIASSAAPADGDGPAGEFEAWTRKPVEVDGLISLLRNRDGDVTES